MSGEFVCAVPSQVGASGQCQWPSGHMTRAIVNVVPGLTEAEMRQALREVFDHIASECGITHEEVETAARARILITAGPVDGPGGTLAYAVLPCGQVRQSVQRYDAGERRWVIHPIGQWPQGAMDWWRVCLHETLHSLGLPHGGDDIMKPAVDPNVSRIGEWTRKELRRRYGPPRATPTPPSPPVPAPPKPGGGFMNTILTELVRYLLDRLPGWKTYGAGVGLVGLGLYQLSQGEVGPAVTSIVSGLGLLFARRAVARNG